MNEGSIDAGLYGYNAFLVGIGIAVFVGGDDVDKASVVLVMSVISGIIQPFLNESIAKSFASHKPPIPALTFAFNIIILTILLGAYQYSGFGLASPLSAFLPVMDYELAGENVRPPECDYSTITPQGVKANATVEQILACDTALVAQSDLNTPRGTIKTCFRESPNDDCGATTGGIFNGALRGVGQIYFSDSQHSGTFVLIGIFICSTVMGLFAFFGSLAGTLLGYILGVDGTTLFLGIWGYNSSLIAMAVGGFFIVLNGRVAILAMFAAFQTAFFHGALAALFSPWGVPAFTLPFCFNTPMFLMLADSMDFVATTPGAPSTPEENAIRYKNQSRKIGGADGYIHDTGDGGTEMLLERESNDVTLDIASEAPQNVRRDAS